MSKDEYYATNAARLDTIIGDSAQVWAAINLANSEYNAISPKESFYVWLQQQYGVKLCFTPEGDLKLANEIVDNYKYLIFLLKFSHHD